MSSLCKNSDFKYTHSLCYNTPIKTEIKFTHRNMDPKYKTFFYHSFGLYADKDVKVHLHFHEQKALKTQDQTTFISVITLQL